MAVPSLDKVPGYNIYIGGFTAVRRTRALANANITHILSVIDWNFTLASPTTQGYRHLHVPVKDMDDEQLIDWFPRSNLFIQEGLNYHPHVSDQGDSNQAIGTDVASNSGVLVHCAMGKSRSATVVVAYLLWDSHRRRHPTIPTAPLGPSAHLDSAPNLSRDEDLPSHQLLTPETALDIVRRGRSLAEPNDGFLDQLHLYCSMGCPSSIDDQPKYQRWLYQKMLQQNLKAHRPPPVAEIRFEDEQEHAQDVVANGAGPSSDAGLDLKCRRCRHLLAKSSLLVHHKQPPTTISNAGTNSTDQSTKDCAHLFLHPLSWMRSCLSDGKLDGRLACPNPKCGANVGRFAWQGIRCSCGGWVTPGFGLARAKVDEAVAVSPDPGHVGAVTAAMARVRLPPGMRVQDARPTKDAGL